MQGFNMGRYVPPDQEGLVSGNKLLKKHPLGARASKLSADGSLTVRFEMPFAVWCAGCPKPTLIAQGVRFNAAKRRVGAYYSTPIFSFRMRHPACGGDIEIRTDPQNTAYVVVSGARRREESQSQQSTAAAHHEPDSLVGDNGRNRNSSGDFAIVTEKERQDRREHAFAHLEKTIADRAALAAAGQRIDELRGAADRQWEDPYARNRRLRQSFREGRKAREEAAADAEDLRDRLSLSIELVPAREEDAARARLVDFGGADGEGGAAAVDRALAKPLFSGGTRDEGKKAPSNSGKGSGKGKEKGKEKEKGRLKSEIAASRMKESLVSEAVGNTRAARDPFLSSPASRDALGRTPPRLPGVKRKRPMDDEPGPPEGDAAKTPNASSALVDYDSD